VQLYKEAGVPTHTFIGVPVFQAEGLTVTTQEMVRQGSNSSSRQGMKAAGAMFGIVVGPWFGHEMNEGAYKVD
jgi:hypothetical protein